VSTLHLCVIHLVVISLAGLLIMKNQPQLHK